MNGKKRLAIILLVLVLLIAGAYALYAQMSAGLSTQQLNVSQAAVDNEPISDDAKADSAEDDTQQRVMAPNFKAIDKDGNEVELYDYLGKPIVLNFWASWCGPCQIEMPDFEEAYKNYGDEVNFLMVNMTDGSRETVETASEFIVAQGYTFPVFFDTAQEAAYGYGVYSIPTTYFLDAEGYGIAQATGAIDGETLQLGLDMILP